MVDQKAVDISPRASVNDMARRADLRVKVTRSIIDALKQGLRPAFLQRHNFSYQASIGDPERWSKFNAYHIPYNTTLSHDAMEASMERVGLLQGLGVEPGFLAKAVLSMPRETTSDGQTVYYWQIPRDPQVWLIFSEDKSGLLKERVAVAQSKKALLSILDLPSKE